jgi:hypothetical protein
MAIADTGASGHYIRPHDPHHSNGTTQNTINVGLPNIWRANSSTCTVFQCIHAPNSVRMDELLPLLAL